MDLNADKQAFVDAVLAPLPPDEATRGMLEQSVHVAGGLMRDGGDAEAREAAARMQASAPDYRRRRLLVRGLGVAVMLGIAWFTLFSPAAFRSQRAMLASSKVADEFFPDVLDDIFFSGDDQEWINQMMAERLPPEHRLVALGDFSQPYRRLRWKAIWDRHPEDPAHFLIYAEECRRELKWPDDFVATGERLDPGNGWFRFLSVMSRSADAVEPAKPASRAVRGGPIIPAVPADIKSGTDLGSILADWDRSLEAPRWEAYRARLFSQRMSGWPPPGDYPDQSLSILFATNHPGDWSALWTTIREFGNFVSALARRHAANGEEAQLEALANRFVKTLERFERSAPDSFQILLNRGAGYASRGFEQAFSELGDTARAADFQAFSRRLDPKLGRPGVRSAPDALDEGRGTYMASVLSSMSTRCTPVEEKDLRGGRLAEYAMTERMLMHGIVFLMSFVVLCFWLAGFRERRGARQVCSRLCGLLRPVDRLWIASLGIVLPVVMYLLCLRLPWLEMRDFTLNEKRALPVLALSCELLLALVPCTAEAVHWRLSRRGAIAGFGWHGMKPGRWIAVLALMSMPVSIAAYKIFVKQSMDEDWIHAMFASLGALPLLWILWMCVAFFAGAAHRRLQRLTVARAMLPFLILATLLTALAIPALHQEEKYWTRRIAYEAVHTTNPLFNDGAGDEYAVWLQDQLRAALAELKQAGP